MTGKSEVVFLYSFESLYCLIGEASPSLMYRKELYYILLPIYSTLSYLIFYFQFLTCIDSGTHINLPEVTYLPVTDIQIVPLSDKGTMAVDGEQIELEPIQATVLPSKGRIMIRNNYF